MTDATDTEHRCYLSGYLGMPLKDDSTTRELAAYAAGTFDSRINVAPSNLRTLVLQLDAMCQRPIRQPEPK